MSARSFSHKTLSSGSGEVDLLAVAGEDGFLFELGGHGVAGRGEALRLDVNYPSSPGGLEGALGYVMDELRGITGSASAVAPVAFVAVPFANTRPVLAVVPEIVVRRTGSSTIAMVADGVAVPSSFELPPAMGAPMSFGVSSSRSPKEWCDAVAEAVRLIEKGNLAKVALAREILVEADEPFSQVAALTNLRRGYPSSHLYAIDGLVGASPELLIERQGLAVRSHPLAGTLPRSSDVATDDALRVSLLTSDKARSEHQYVADMIRDILSPFCSELHVPLIPEVMSLANVHHLATPVAGMLLSGEIDVLRLVAALHPTPAVGGTPTNIAVDVIAELEELDRGYYAGAVGWVDAEGNGSFAVALRGAQIEGSCARVIAGNGIVAGSDPHRELEETRWKLQVMLSALVRP